MPEKLRVCILTEQSLTNTAGTALQPVDMPEKLRVRRLQPEPLYSRRKNQFNNKGKNRSERSLTNTTGTALRPTEIIDSSRNLLRGDELKDGSRKIQNINTRNPRKHERDENNKAEKICGDETRRYVIGFLISSEIKEKVKQIGPTSDKTCHIEPGRELNTSILNIYPPTEEKTEEK
ncbi:hypothetical protein ILUMI_22760 [Ignelater luminosus]|uniref:Uncharacterized protein n=1 Tax=Ignelater luminosus TaxID=2038154 RepID=A0A8K0G2B0_IGNLU|nr:hypothetical protein ILUMI_22760 [Ignelater luminosus]